MKKTIRRFFTIADFEEEEIWLREQHKEGWKLTDITIPCFYHFESCEPEDVIYRLDFGNDDRPEDYRQLLSDFGWEYFADCAGWSYFRKPASEAVTEEEGELFSDDESRAEQISKVFCWRYAPIMTIFLCAVMPNFFRLINGEFTGTSGIVMGVLYAVLFAVYVFLLTYCGIKLKRIKDRYKKD